MASIQLLFDLLLVVLMVNWQVDSVQTQDLDCVDNEIRVFSDSGFRYIDYCVSGQWSRLCTGGGPWGIAEANVVCRQLGFLAGLVPRGSCMVSVEPTRFFRFTQSCTSAHNTVQECGGVTAVDCSSCNSVTGEYGHIPLCNSACTDGQVRLVDGEPNRSGRVEVCRGGAWGTVCNSNQPNIQQIANRVCTVIRGTEAIGLIQTVTPGFVPIRRCDIPNGVLVCVQLNDTSCDHSMDLTVDCRTYQELQISTTPSPPICPTSPATTCPECPTTTTSTSSLPTCPECPTTTTNPLPTCPSVTCPNCPDHCNYTESDVPNLNITLNSDLPFPTNATVICDTNSTIIQGNVTGNGSMATDCDNDTLVIVLGAVCGALGAVMVAMVVGWICDCVCLRKCPKIKNFKNGLPRRALNPGYDGVHQLKSVAPREHNYEETELQDTPPDHVQHSCTELVHEGPVHEGPLQEAPRNRPNYENAEIIKTFEARHETSNVVADDGEGRFKGQELGYFPPDHTYHVLEQGGGDSPQVHTYHVLEQGREVGKTPRQEAYNKLVHVAGSPEKPQMRFLSSMEDYSYSKLDI